MIKIYTDGSCKSNGNEKAIGGLGIAIYENDKVIKKVSRTFAGTTNNRMEYRAMLEAMKIVIENGWENVEFYSDSKLLLDTITQWMYGWQKKGWRKTGAGSKSKIKNLDLVLELWELKPNLKNPKFIWVKGHDGDEGNELADELTNQLDLENPVVDKINYEILDKYNVKNNLAPR